MFLHISFFDKKLEFNVIIYYVYGYRVNELRSLFVRVKLSYACFYFSNIL